MDNPSLESWLFSHCGARSQYDEEARVNQRELAPWPCARARIYTAIYVPLFPYNCIVAGILLCRHVSSHTASPQARTSSIRHFDYHTRPFYTQVPTVCSRRKTQSPWAEEICSTYNQQAALRPMSDTSQCMQCRGLKIKCTRSSDEYGTTCQQCQTRGRTCVYDGVSFCDPEGQTHQSNMESGSW